MTNSLSLKKQKRVYLDHAASTPLDVRVLRAMEPYFFTQYGNPGSLHGFGQEAIAAVDAARESIARHLGASFREILFTSSATEANNLALRGAVRAWKRSAVHHGRTPRIVVSAIEHESVLETARALMQEEGAEVIEVSVNAEGLVDLDEVSRALNEDTAIVSVMWGNNEVGTIQPIAKIAARIAAFRGSRPWPQFHTDAAQAFPFVSATVHELGVDMMTLSAHKMEGPKGVAALYVRELPHKGNAVGGGGDTRSEIITPIITGGGQEFGLRSGTENVPLVVGFATAMELAVRMRKKECVRLESLRQYAMREIKNTSRSITCNGPRGNHRAIALPHILNVHIAGRPAEDSIMFLDMKGIAVSSGSACRARAVEPSYVIRALGHSSSRAKESIRISFGRTTKKSDIDAWVRVMKRFLS